MKDVILRVHFHACPRKRLVNNKGLVVPQWFTSRGKQNKSKVISGHAKSASEAIKLFQAVHLPTDDFILLREIAMQKGDEKHENTLWIKSCNWKIYVSMFEKVNDKFIHRESKNGKRKHDIAVDNGVSRDQRPIKRQKKPGNFNSA